MSTFFLFYKKGTSLVELIAVIVIMGIIAGIAIPTTIAVIGRQKRSAACKSGDNIVATAKQFLLAAVAEGSSENMTRVPATGNPQTGWSVTSAQLKDAGELEKDPVTGGSLTVTISLTDNSFTITATSDLTIDNQPIHWDTTDLKFVYGAGQTQQQGGGN